jgi:hypothetical protein
MTLPTTRERVPANTSSEVNQQIQTDTEARVRRALANPARIDRRIHELGDEWDIERAIELNASALAFLGTVLGFFAHPYWLALPASSLPSCSSTRCRAGAHRFRSSAAWALERPMKSRRNGRR